MSGRGSPPAGAPGAGAGAGPLPFRGSTNAPFKTDVVRRTALSTATLLRTRTSKAAAAASSSQYGPGGLSSSATGLLLDVEDDDDDGPGQLSEVQLAKLEEGVNVKIDGEIQVLLDGFRQLVGLAMIRDKDRYLLAQESYQAEMRAHNMVRAAQSLTLLSASLKLSLILSLESAQDEPEEKNEDEDDGTQRDGKPESAREIIEDTERLRRRCAELLGKLGVGLGHAPHSVNSEAQSTTDPSSQAPAGNADPVP
ncbi:unnamed protein product [Tilletia controversa]|nr:unnamed protein product [Tilletia controversa]